jgi:cysteine sulfinate desulfinase/cysteine desulfurase-like protein
MGVGEDRLRSAIRFSLGPTLTEADIDEAAERIIASVQAVKAPRTPALGRTS